MQILRSKAALMIVLITAALDLGACQMTALWPQDGKLFEDYQQ